MYPAGPALLSFIQEVFAGRTSPSRCYVTAIYTVSHGQILVLPSDDRSSV